MKYWLVFYSRPQLTNDIERGLHLKTGDRQEGTNKKGPDKIGAFRIHGAIRITYLIRPNFCKTLITLVGTVAQSAFACMVMGMHSQLVG